MRVLPDGPSSFYVVARDAFKKQRWVKLGGTAELSIADSRERAREVLKRLRAGLEPFEAPPVRPDTVADVVADVGEAPRRSQGAAHRRRAATRP